MKDNLIDKINNETFTLPCHNSLSSYPFNFCDTEGTKNTINTPCTISDFTTGFYFENPPNIDIGILRKPSDLLIAMDAMQQNRLKLNSTSHYTKIINNTKLLNDLSTLTTVNTTTGDINIIPQIIPTTGEVSDIVLEVKNRLSEGNDKLINPLIWKALNYSGYDIPVQWFDTSTDLTDDSDNLIFNDYVYALSKVNNWAKNNDGKTLNNPTMNHDDYQMDKWRRKYLKYKQKYFGFLNNNLLDKRLDNLLNKVNKKLKIELNEKLGELKTTLYSEIENMSE